MKWKRRAALRVGRPGERGREWTSLRMEFSVEVEDAREPNRLQAKVYNLSDDSIAYMEQDGMVAQLLAGYEVPGLLGVGEISRVEPVWEGTDRVVTLECADGRTAYTSRTSTSWGRTTVHDVIEQVADDMGFEEVDLSRVDNKDLPGLALSGPSRRALDQLTRTIDADWQIERGQLLVLPRETPTERRALLLDSDSGLIGSPQRTDDGVKAKMLLEHRMRIRQKVRIDAREVSGFWVVTSYTHTLDTHATPWHTEIEAERIRG